MSALRDPSSEELSVGLFEFIVGPFVSGDGVAAAGDFADGELVEGFEVIGYGDGRIVTNFSGWRGIGVVVADADHLSAGTEVPVGAKQAEDFFPRGAAFIVGAELADTGDAEGGEGLDGGGHSVVGLRGRGGERDGLRLGTKVNSRRAANDGTRGLAAAKGTGARRELLPENAGESLVRIVARIEGDLDDRSRTGVQLPGGALEAEPAHEGLDRFSYHAGENAVKVIRGKAGDAGECAERERLIEMSSDVGEDTEEAGLVVLLGGGLHRTLRVLPQLLSVCLMVFAQSKE